MQTAILPFAALRRGLAPVIALCAAATVCAAPAMLKEEPAKGVLRVGEVVYVDDGSCPAGEVKKITGGNQKAGKTRLVECVKRPEGL